MSKFKIGDMVIPEEFSSDGIFFCPDMPGLSGKPGRITNIDDNETGYRVHNYWWPESSLKLAEAARKPFDLEAALKGEPVVTRDGRKADEIHLFETYISIFPLFAIIDGVVYKFTKDGRFITTGDSDMDLFMTPKKIEYWVNVYKNDQGVIYTSMNSYSSEREAKDNKIGGECIDQVKIWEEMIMKTAIELISHERTRQIRQEGWTHEHDDQHDTGDLAHAAAAYASAELYRRTTSKGYDNTPHIWPFERKWWKPTPNDRIRELVKAGALIVAEIERLQRINEKEVQS